jgi:predicted enzyme related to lactoylglutathione lyase
MKPESAATVFQVANVDSGLRYYKEVLGFAEVFRFGDYAGVELGEARIHLCSHGTHNRPVGGGTIYLFCDDVDTYYAEIKSKGGIIKNEPHDYDYGMRDFMALDPDGNHLAFGCEIEKSL